jgi:hypothetical protein
MKVYAVVFYIQDPTWGDVSLGFELFKDKEDAEEYARINEGVVEEHILN